jgi:hypothetical protein
VLPDTLAEPETDMVTKAVRDWVPEVLGDRVPEIDLEGDPEPLGDVDTEEEPL